MYQNMWDSILNFSTCYPTHCTKMFNEILSKHLKSQENTKNVSILINTLSSFVYYISSISSKLCPKICKITQKVTLSDTR